MFYKVPWKVFIFESKKINVFYQFKFSQIIKYFIINIELIIKIYSRICVYVLVDISI